MTDLIATPEGCDPNDPKDSLRFLASALPNLGGVAYTPHQDIQEAWSERWTAMGVTTGPRIAALADENGMVHVSQLPVPTIKLRLPHSGQPHPMNGLLEWVPVDEPDVAPIRLPSADEMDVLERAVMAEDLRRVGAIPTPEPEIVTAEVVHLNAFNPDEHIPSTVIGYLIGADVGERRRVLAAEMRGKNRNKILNDERWRGL